MCKSIKVNISRSKNLQKGEV